MFIIFNTRRLECAPWTVRLYFRTEVTVLVRWSLRLLVCYHPSPGPSDRLVRQMTQSRAWVWRNYVITWVVNVKLDLPWACGSRLRIKLILYVQNSYGGHINSGEGLISVNKGNNLPFVLSIKLRLVESMAGFSRLSPNAVFTHSGEGSVLELWSRWMVLTIWCGLSGLTDTRESVEVINRNVWAF